MFGNPNSKVFFNRPPGYKVFIELEPNPYKKGWKICFQFLNNYLEFDDQKIVNFIGETLTFTLQLMKT